jgi:cytoskeleton protein RodZ
MPQDRPGDFGSKLREARERKGVTLRQIANRTKISMSALEALERSDISRLPGGIFSRAFVRSYAAEVGLDPEKTIQEFIAQFPHDSVTAGHPTSEQVEDNEALESERRMARTVLAMLAVSVPLAGVVLYFGVAGRATDAPAGQGVAAPKSRTTPAVEPVTTTDLPAAAPADPQARVAAAPPPPAAQAPAPSPDRLTVGLSVRRPVWIQVTVDGAKAVDRLLQPGERETLEVTRELVLTAGDAAAVSLTLNGTAARPLGKAGDVVRARVTPANFKEYLQQ